MMVAEMVVQWAGSWVDELVALKDALLVETMAAERAQRKVA